MKKILKPYTIIPTELYVQRDADRQLDGIIEDMGRPGYILVSRQMGKTNLLLNAKRRLQSKDDIYVYIDLSNPFQDSRTCFENIIDVAVDTNSETFEKSYKTILQNRAATRDFPPHKQHLSELRILLNEIRGKLVIILDEIDALTKTDYSDQIFAQIRSVYFSRVNYKELEKLTYILSGVIEPSEIIKDPKISPFNIGQKIFLNDFDRFEFDDFIIKSRIKFGRASQERIFYWTNGNPRMTWDICSAVEDNFDHDQAPDIDKIVHKLYLTSYDKPPIDHIRDIVRNDRDIRNAVVEILEGNLNKVSDKVKSKLYLAGIIDFDNDQLEIKNEIIKLTLTKAWIRSLEEEDKGLIQLAVELFAKDKFEESLLTFEKFLADNSFSDTETSLYYYYMGIAAYRCSIFEKATVYLDRAHFDVNDESKNFYKLLHIKGLVYYYREMIDESLGSLKQVIEAKRNDDTYLRALLNYGSFAIASDRVDFRIESVKIFKNIVEEKGIDKDRIKGDFLDEVKAISFYNLAQLNLIDNDEETATLNYREAIGLSRGEKPSIVLALLRITKKSDEKRRILEDVIDLIIEGKIKPSEPDIERPLDFTYDELREIAVISYITENGELFKKVIPALSFLGEKSVLQHLYELSVFVVNKRTDWETAKKILSGIWINGKEFGAEIDAETKYKTLKLLSFVSNAKDDIEYHLEYVKLFAEQRHEQIDYLDMEIFANTVFVLTERRNFHDALRVLNVINSIRNTVQDTLQINYLVLFHLELNVYLALNDQRMATQKAKDLLAFAQNDGFRHQKSNLLGETGFDLVKQNAEAVINRRRKIPPLIKEKSYQRNDQIKVKYQDGRIVMGKFKKLQDDIISGICSIVN